jgi:hypothetical protein
MNTEENKEMTPQERRKLYKKEYNKLYYHFIKNNDEVAHRKRVDRATVVALDKYYKKKELKNKVDEPIIDDIKPKRIRSTRITGIKINI